MYFPIFYGASPSQIERQRRFYLAMDRLEAYELRLPLDENIAIGDMVKLEIEEDIKMFRVTRLDVMPNEIHAHIRKEYLLLPMYREACT